MDPYGAVVTTHLGRVGKKAQVLIPVLNPITPLEEEALGMPMAAFPGQLDLIIHWYECPVLSLFWRLNCSRSPRSAPLSCSCSLCHQDTKLPKNLNFWVRQDSYHQAGLGCYLALGQAATTTWENLLWVIFRSFALVLLSCEVWDGSGFPLLVLTSSCSGEVKWQNWSLGRRTCQGELQPGLQCLVQLCFVWGWSVLIAKMFAAFISVPRSLQACSLGSLGDIWTSPCSCWIRLKQVPACRRDLLQAQGLDGENPLIKAKMQRENYFCTKNH